MGDPASIRAPRDQLGPSWRLALRLALAALVGIVAIASVNAAFGLGGADADEVIRTWGSSLAYVLAAGVVALRAAFVRELRSGWILLAVGLALYCAGNLLWTLWLEEMEEAPIPSVADALWLSLYPACYAGLLSLARRGRRGTPAGVWLDGIVAGFGIAALGGAVVFRPVLDSATGSSAAVATNLAYPVADLLLAALVVGILALRGWKLDPRWTSLGAGFLVLCVADMLYLLQVAGGDPEAGLIPNVFYMAAVALLARAAWQPRRPAPPDRLDGWSMLLVPGAFALAAVGLLVYDRFERLDPIAFTLALLTILGALVRTALSFRDLRTLAQTRREATTDELTSLPNRRLFLRTVDGRIARARRNEQPLALLIIDLNQFKELNDALGHKAGDELLRQLGPRLKATVRSSDMLARLGGDEFGLLLEPPAALEAALDAAARIREALEQPFEVQGLRMRVGASVGIALFPRDASDGQRLLQHADAAMYRSKAAGTPFEVFARDRDEQSREALELASRLPDAIANGELELRFQPIARADRRPVGMEALVRWAHPERGLLPPNLFIPIAEQSGHMRALTRWILDTALEHAGLWREVGHGLRLSVNVSVADLLDVEFPRDVARALAKHAIDPADLVLEVTETTIMSDRVRVCEVLERLAELGVGLSLDDFGTGYSSLTHLKTLPVSEIKIDRAFVAGMSENRSDREIVRATIQLAGNLGLRVVAEGVEDGPTWQLLDELGCELIQGYHLAMPLAPGDLDAFLVEPAALARLS